MIFDIRIDPGVSARFGTSLERQVGYKLAAFDDAVARLDASLHEVVGAVKGTLYECRLDVELDSGERFALSARGPRLQICIADAVSRLNRKLSRRVQGLGLPQVAESTWRRLHHSSTKRKESI